MNGEERGLPGKLALAVTYTALTILALVGNTTIVVIYFRWKTSFKIYKVTYIFLLSLTLANLAIAVGVMPLSIASLIAGQWVFGATWCTMNGFIFVWMATVSILTILLISLHRATVVLSPLRRIIKTGQARILAASVWLFSLIIPIPPLVGVSTYEYSPTRAFCRVRFVSYDADKTSNIYSLLTVSLFVILPLLIVCVINIALFRISVRLLQSEGHLQNQGKKRPSPGRRISRTIRGELKAFTTVTLVMGIFVLCWAPQVILTIYGIISQQPYHDGLHTLQAVCIFLNSALNPYIYIYANKETRKRFAEIFLCKTTEKSRGLIPFNRFTSRCSTTSLNAVRHPLVKPGTPRADSDQSGGDNAIANKMLENRPLKNNFVTPSDDSNDRLVWSNTLGGTAECDASQTAVSGNGKI